MIPDWPNDAKFSEGGMWEKRQFHIEPSCEVYDYNGQKPCRHCHSHRVRTSKRGVTTHYWTCPAVVVAWNEGGWSSTGVCVQCILEGIDEMGLQLAELVAG
jgi:hypothetical protein